MTYPNRRAFLAASAATLSAATYAGAAQQPNERIRVAIMGCRKTWGVFDKDGKIHDAAQKGAVGWLERWFKK